MLINNGDGTFTMGPADVMCIFRLPDSKYHVAILEESPMPGEVQSLESLLFIRLKSKAHHTDGAESIDGAQQHIAELRQKILISDTNVVSDVALEINDPICVFPVRNWIKEKIPLQSVLCG